MITRATLLAAAALAATAGAALAQPPAPDFVRMAGASDKFEIEEAKLAMTRTHNPRIRQFAQMMVRPHNASTIPVKAPERRVSLKAVDSL